MNELQPLHASQQSFYGKAQYQYNGNTIELYSYNTLVPIIDQEEHKAIVIDSPTTLKHIKEFLKQFGFKAENKKQILTDYGGQNLLSFCEDFARKNNLIYELDSPFINFLDTQGNTPLIIRPQEFKGDDSQSLDNFLNTPLNALYYTLYGSKHEIGVQYPNSLKLFKMANEALDDN